MTIKIDHFDDDCLRRGEWLVTNGLGGFASGTISGVPSRRYHALLNAALPNPYGRTVMLNYVADLLILPDKTVVPLSSVHIANQPVHESCLVEYHTENGIPVWTYQYQDIIVEKSLLLLHRQNTVHVSYKLQSPHEGIEIVWRPFLQFRLLEQLVNANLPNDLYSVHSQGTQHEIEAPDFPVLRLFSESHAPFTVTVEMLNDVFYAIEADRGYESTGNLSSPGYFVQKLQPKVRETFIASTEPWEVIFALPPKAAWTSEKIRKRNLIRSSGLDPRNPIAAKLVYAADQFVITPSTRHDDMIRLRALGEEAKTIIAGYPWFTDWGRDTMISLEGLTLMTGRSRDAYSILQTFSHYVRNGLIPNMFPDGANKGLYNTADATLWYFHAIDRYLAYTQDESVLEFLLPKLHEIIDAHLRGTDFGIGVDKDGLLRQGQQGFALTWMDAKVGDWVVTPRRGKAVEINALWYNALKLYEEWTGRNEGHSQRCYDSFNEKFLIPSEPYLYDVIDGENGNDPSMRPNQLFAISLKYPVLADKHWKAVLDKVDKELFTPFGLRTLSPNDPNYRSTYDGDLRSRDAAYHQGTVWPWLIGPYIDVWRKVHPDEPVQNKFKGLEEHLNNNCMGTIGEIFDAGLPHRSRGCFAQAWSIAELLRTLLR